MRATRGSRTCAGGGATGYRSAVGVVRGAVRVLVVVKVTFQVQVYKLSALLQNGGVPKLYSRGRTTHTSKSLLTSTV
jgi:hypothetical protein